MVTSCVEDLHKPLAPVYPCLAGKHCSGKVKHQPGESEESGQDSLHLDLYQWIGQGGLCNLVNDSG